MRRTNWISGLILSLSLLSPFAVAQTQGKGHGKEHKPAGGQGQGAASKGKGQGQGRAATTNREQQGSAQRLERPGQGRGSAARGDRNDGPGKSEARAARAMDRSLGGVAGGEVERRPFRELAGSAKHGDRIAGRAVARAVRRGVSEDDFVIAPEVNRVRVFNRAGALLVDMDDDRDVGIWRVVTEPDRNRSGAPSFCRSGAGHPVWGRQWCVEKGFGLGDDRDFRWARGIDFDNVIFQRPITMTELLTRELLLGTLGDNAFNRLAAHAISLGLVEPLAGRWIGEPAGGGPRVLLVSSGPQPIAEMVDLDRDNRADLLVVATRP